MTLTIQELVSDNTDVQEELLSLSTKAEGQVVAAMPSVAEDLDYYDVAEWYTLMSDVSVPGGQLFIGVINPDYLPPQVREGVKGDRAALGLRVVTVDSEGDNVQFGVSNIFNMRTN